MGGRFIKKPRPNLPFWVVDISRDYFFHRVGPARLGHLLEEILAEFHDEATLEGYELNPIEEKLKGNWVTLGKKKWKIPQDIDFRQLYEWLCLGMWEIAVEKEGSKKKINMHRTYHPQKPEDSILCLIDNSLYFSLFAWHDMTPLYISINPDYCTVQNS